MFGILSFISFINQIVTVANEAGNSQFIIILQAQDAECTKSILNCNCVAFIGLALDDCT